MRTDSLLDRCAVARLCPFGLLIGATGFVNAWDLPILLALAAASILVRAARDGRVLAGLSEALILAAFAVLPYAPFYVALDGSGRRLYP